MLVVILYVHISTCLLHSTSWINSSVFGYFLSLVTAITDFSWFTELPNRVDPTDQLETSRQTEGMESPLSGTPLGELSHLE